MKSGESKEYRIKLHPVIGCCGIDCGLCPRYYTAGASRCPGCCGPDFFNKHPSCRFITCCVKKNRLEVCAQCNDFPCSGFNGWDAGDSFVSHLKSISNLNFIKMHGIRAFIEQQKRRIELLRVMLERFDEGKSKSFYCLAAALLSIDNLKEVLSTAEQEIKICNSGRGDIKKRALILRRTLNDFADEQDVRLILRKKKVYHGE